MVSYPVNLPMYQETINELLPDIGHKSSSDIAEKLKKINQQVQEMGKENYTALDVKIFNETIVQPLTNLSEQVHLSQQDADTVILKNIPLIRNTLNKISFQSELFFITSKLPESLRAEKAIADAENKATTVLAHLEGYQIQDHKLLAKVILGLIPKLFLNNLPDVEKYWSVVLSKAKEDEGYSLYKAYQDGWIDKSMMDHHKFDRTDFLCGHIKNLLRYPMSEKQKLDIIIEACKSGHLPRDFTLASFGITDPKLLLQFIYASIENRQTDKLIDDSLLEMIHSDQKLQIHLLDLMVVKTPFTLSFLLPKFTKDPVLFEKYTLKLLEQDSEGIGIISIIAAWKGELTPEAIDKIFKIAENSGIGNRRTLLFSKHAQSLPEERLFQFASRIISESVVYDDEEFSLLLKLNFKKKEFQLKIIGALLDIRTKKFDQPISINFFLKSNPEYAQTLPYISFSGNTVDLAKAIIHPDKAPNQPIRRLLEIIQKSADKLEEGDKGYEMMLEWVISLDLRTRTGGISEDQLAEAMPFLQEIVELRNPTMRFSVTEILFDRKFSLASPQLEKINKLLSARHTPLIKLMLLPLCEINNDNDWGFIEILNDSGFLDITKRRPILTLLEELRKSKELDASQKFHWIRTAFTSDPSTLTQMEREQPRASNRALQLNQICLQAATLGVLCNSFIVEKLKDIKKYEEINLLVEELMKPFGEKIENFSKKYNETIKQLSPEKRMSLFVYSLCYYNYFEEYQEPFLKCYLEFLKELLDGNFKGFRDTPKASEDEHWRQISEMNPHLANEWLKGAQFSCADLAKTFANNFFEAACKLDPNLQKLIAPLQQIRVEDIPSKIRDLEIQQQELAKQQQVKTLKFTQIKLQIALLKLLKGTEAKTSSLIDSLKNIYENFNNQIPEESKINPEAKDKVIKELSKLRSQFGAKPMDKFTVRDTDEWTHLLLMGDMTLSCQGVSEFENNKSLLSFIVDPSNRMLAILDENKQMVARAVTRLLINRRTGEKVMFLEETYVQSKAPENAKLLLVEAAKERAKQLNITLVGSHVYQDYSSTKFPDWLDYKGGRAPFHYVDAMTFKSDEGTIDGKTFELDPKITKFVLYRSSESVEKERKSLAEVT